MNSPYKAANTTEAVENLAGYTKIVIKNLKLDMSIGVHDFERAREQPVIVSVEATVQESPDWREDSINNVLNYESIVSAIQYIGKRGHINLLETFAGHIVDFCLKDPLIKDVKVLVEKPEIFPFADSVAIEIFRSKTG